MRAAFYAPMKSPDDPVPSGDRAMARALQSALAAANVDITLATDFRSRDSSGNTTLQQQLIDEANAVVTELVPKGRTAGWQVWVTYHNYYKAPDLIGPTVATALDIPYVLIEATRARKRLTGPWARFAQAAEAASDSATAILHVTERDREALLKYRNKNQIVASLPPFLATDALPFEGSHNGGMISVGMMRYGDKLASYQLISEALALVEGKNWDLALVGDGPARPDVEKLMAPFADNVRVLGALPPNELQDAYSQASLFFWPGVNEAFGMVYLEAQAAGLAVVAQDRPGVRDVLAPGSFYPSADAGAAGLASRLDMLLSLPKLKSHLGQNARRYVARHHLMSSASARLADILSEVVM